MGRPAVSRAKVNALGIDAICAQIADGVSLTAIAKAAKVSIGTLLVWIESDTERSARVRDVRKQTAKLWEEKAESVLLQAKKSFGLAKAKELAHHYRWRASKIAPREYGDKVAVGGDPDGPPVSATMTVTFVAPKA